MKESQSQLTDDVAFEEEIKAMNVYVNAMIRSA